LGSAASWNVAALGEIGKKAHAARKIPVKG
jgi:hypothetical protein